MRETIKQLREMDACNDALDWLRTLDDDTTHQQAWDACQRGDWMLWLLERTATEQDHKKLVAVAWECALLVLRHCGAKCPEYMRVGGCVGTKEAVRASVKALGAVARVSWAARPEMAVREAGAAGEVAGELWASCASKAARTAGEEPWAFWAAREAVWKKQADIVRKHFPDVPVLF